ncbi:MAG TPA: hypothetical protein VKR38_04855, partial [Usitatibacter sp.]|nr:hypothetical protein [Usitatibacter sp.]
FSSYEDDGTVSMGDRHRPLRGDTTFRTLFLRPSYFRFEFASPHPYEPLAHIVTTTICGCDGISPYMWQKHHDSPPRLEICESLELAIAGATGISSGSAYTISQLLMPKPDGSLAALEELSVAESESVDGVTCNVISGKLLRASAETHLFVDPETSILRRVDSRFDRFSSQEVRRHIKVNAEIEVSRFRMPSGEI